jgi:hypothetical protein
VAKIRGREKQVVQIQVKVISLTDQQRQNMVEQTRDGSNKSEYF